MSRTKNTRGWRYPKELFSRRPCAWMQGKYWRKMCARIERMQEKQIIRKELEQ